MAPEPKQRNDGRDHSNDDDGVDVTLIDEMLRLKPRDRLLQNDRMIRTVEDLREAFERRGGHEP